LDIISEYLSDLTAVLATKNELLFDSLIVITKMLKYN